MKLSELLPLTAIRIKFKLLTLLNKRKAAESAFELFCTPLDKAPIRRPSVFNNSEALRFNFNGNKIRGYIWNLDKPHTILILHGFGSAAYKFHRYVSLLIAKGYRVIAVDAPAHGSSEGETVNALEYSELIQFIAQKYGPIDGYLAHSFGGIALSLALEQIPHSAHNKMVLIAPATETTTAIDLAFKMLHLNNSKVKKEFYKIIEQKSGHPVEWFSIKRAMQQIQAQVLWVHDELDDITPFKDAVAVKTLAYPNIEFLFTNGLGHRKIYHDQAVKDKVVDFL
ncbi:MAG: alpha/beta hydrolase [Ferruginibacter sp.]